MKHLIYMIFCFFCLNLFAQSEAANWYFGYNAGISFNQATGKVVSVNNGQLFTNEGCTSISDDTGNLLLYTDGRTIWNKNHQFMANGQGLLGDASSTQSAIIVPKPNDSTIFYVFTVDNSFNGNSGLNYSVVDITLNGGLGEVITKNVNLLGNCSEKLTAVLKDCFSQSIWVLTFASENGDLNVYDTFHAFEVSSSGVNNTAVKSPASVEITDARGYLKLSPDGTKMACANFSADNDNLNPLDELILYDFDVATGIASNPIDIAIRNENHNPYGVEFSPNSKLLYVHSTNNYRDPTNINVEDDQDVTKHKSTLTQFDLTQPDIEGSQIVIDERQLYRSALQLGPDGKIYRALTAAYSLGTSYLGVINNPNNIGAACNYQHNAVDLSPNRCGQGLPPFIQSLFNTQIDIIKDGLSDVSISLCEGDTYTLLAENTPNATYTWTRDDILLPNTTYDLTVDKSGHYEVIIDSNDGECTIEGQAYVIFNKNPIINDTALAQCDEDGTKDGLTIFNLHEAYNNATTSSNISTKFYTDSARTIEVNGNAFKNTNNPQTIYTKAINNETGCYATAELTLSVSVTDANDVVMSPVCDDDGIEDGFYTFHLQDAESEMLSGIPITGLTISYYETYNDALLETNSLGASYTNTTPYSQTIYARVENSNNCYGISDIQLTVNKLPNVDAENESHYYCLNTFPQTMTLNAGIIKNFPNDYTYSWSSGETTHEIQINKPGTYISSVTNAAGCSKTRTITVEASNVATFKSIEVVDVAQNNTISAIVSGEGVYEYSLLDNHNAIYRPFQQSNIFEQIKPGFYTVSVKDIKNNCGIVNNKISVIGFPKYFTPNNDGTNDTWQVLGVSGQFYSNSKISIFDRYGKLIKEIDPYGKGWDGSFNGHTLPADDYWFSVKLEDGRIFKNHFTLKR